MNLLSIYWFRAIIIFTLWIVAFIPVYPELWDSWINHSDNSHGMLVPLITGFLIWNKKGELIGTQPKSSNWGGVILALSLSLYILALAGQIVIVERVMVVFSLIGLVLFNFGPTVFKIIAFPLFYLIFMVPVPVSIYGLVAFPLQLFATKIAYTLIQAMNIPVLKEGNMLYFAQTQLEVAEACSGLRSMVAFVMLGVLFAYGMEKGGWRRLVMVASAIPLAVICNIARVTGTGILAHYYGGQVARGFLHEFSGLSVFVLGLMIMAFEYRLLNFVKTTKA